MKNLLVIAILMSVSPATAQYPVEVLPQSRAWIEGSATGTRFTCRADSLQGSGVWDKTVSGELTISVTSIDCGNNRMTEDLRDLLNVHVHPVIEYEVLRAWPLADSVSATAHGMLTISGVSREIEVTGSLERADEEAGRIRGSVDLLLTDFGLEPPSKFLGLIRVRDEITVRFDIIAAIAPAAAESLPQTDPKDTRKS